MGILWDLFWEKKNFGQLTQQEIKESKIIQQNIVESEIIIEIQDKLNNDISREIGQIKKKINSTHTSFGESELRKLRENIILTLQQEIHEEVSRAKVDLQNLFESRIQKLENKPSPSIDLTSIQNAIRQIQTNIQTDNEKINQRFKTLEQTKQTQIPQPIGDNNLKNEIETLKNNFNVQTQKYNNLRLAFDSISRENATIRQQFSQNEERISRLEKENAAKDQSLKNLEARFEEKIKSLEERIKKLEKGGGGESPPWIKSFDIPRAQSPKAFFRGDTGSVKTKLSQSIQDADNLLLYLNQSQIEDPARTSFIKNMRWCKEALEKFRDKYDFEDCDDGELSEEITTKFFKIISENILDNIMIAIYRGGENAAGYKDFLKKLNDYLSKYGIYTKYIEPKSKLEGDTLSSIEPPISKRTSIAADDGKIDEVELLPYFMDYEDDDGNLDAKRKRGRVVTLKYGA